MITGSQFRELLAKAPDPSGFLKAAEQAGLQVMPDIGMKEALYHHEKGRRFRPTRRELEADQFTCPYCVGTKLRKIRLRSNEHGFTCPRCRWTIHRDDVFDPKQKQPPEVREPGDATDNTNKVEPLELSMAEVVDQPVRVV
jgi:hypothetical protein